MRARTVTGLMKEIRKKIRQTLENDVYLEVVAVQKEHIQKDVYDKYNPIDYVRRGEKWWTS